MSKRPEKSDARDLAAEIVRRCAAAGGSASYVVRLGDPPTANERLQLAAARILRRPIAIMPTKCLNVAQWIARFGRA
jgi:hypothetical protein